MSIAIDKQTVVIQDGVKIIYRFPLDEFSDTELDFIKNKKFCTGCNKMPIAGFRDRRKYNWCSFSRKIAVMEEDPKYFVAYPSWPKRVMNRLVLLEPISSDSE